jgi:hypothetical protein
MTPICVDLDGTLIKENLVFYSIRMFLTRYPCKIFHAFFWLLKGYPYFKCKIAKLIPINPKNLTYNRKVIQFLTTQNNPLYLVTGSAQNYANQIRNHLSKEILFLKAFGASQDCRLTGRSKAAFLTKNFSSFIYVGNSADDVHVWKHALEIVGVNVAKKEKKWIKKQNKPYLFLN